MSEPSLADRIVALGAEYDRKLADMDAQFRKMGKIVYHLILQSGKGEAFIPKDFEKDWMITFNDLGDRMHLKIGRMGPMTPIELPAGHLTP